MTPQKRAEYLDLFRQFATDWLNREEGERHNRTAKEAAAAGRENFRHLLSEIQQGNDVGTAPLRLLLPHFGSQAIRDGGMWVSHAPAIRGSAEGYLSAQWVPKRELPTTAAALIRFVQTCNDHPDQLAEACQQFAALACTKGLQTGMVTPILNALRPDTFILLNNRSRRVLNYFAETTAGHAIAEYPRANALGLSLIAEVTTEMLELAGRYDLHVTHLFDHFSHFLVAINPDLLHPPSKGKRAKPSISLDRSDPLCAAHVLATLYPDPEVRQVCLEYLSEAIRFASTLQNNNWGLTLHLDKIRLNVGPVEVLTLRKNEVLLLLDAESLAPRDRKKISPPVKFSRDEYRRVPGEKGIGEMGVEEFIKLRDQFRAAHCAFIRKASAPFTAIRWANTHSPGLLQHLRQATATEIPDPDYARPLPPETDNPGATPPVAADGKQPYHAASNPQQKPYPLEAIAEETGYPIPLLRHWIGAIERKGQAIIYGPPGTGKTFLAERLARHLAAEGEGGMQELVQFHPSYSYEDFVIGIRPVSREGVVEYPMQDGRFLDFCRKARAWRGTCVLVIDEINRADISRAFGELMYLLEYRDRTIELAGGSPFRIPGNVRIIGTMNTADRSIALLDYALRRRFAFIELRPDYGLLRSYHARHRRQVEGLIGVLERMNSRINNPHYELGISFFLHPNLPELLPSIWEMEIEPYLAEYFYDQPAAVEEFRWEKVKEGMEME